MLIQSSLRRPAAIAAVLLFGASAVASASSSPTRTAAAASAATATQKNDFMRAMESSSSRQVRAEKAAAANLRRKIAAAAVPRQPHQKQQQQQQAPRRLDDNADGEDGEWDAFGFDVADYSLKYAGCSAVATWSDELAEQGGDEDGGQQYDATVVSTQKFVVFRLCPTDACSDTRTFGCSNNYGEYLLDMAEYLQYLREYREEQLEKYCEYCEECVEAEEEWQQQQWQNNYNNNGNYNYNNGNYNYNQDGDQENQEENDQDGEQDQDQDQDQDQEGEDNQQDQNEGQDEDGEQEGEQEEGGGRRRRLEDAAEEDNAEDADDGEQQQQDGEDDANDGNNNGNNYQADEYGGCSDYDACSTYGNVCNDGNNNGGNNNNNNNDLTEYFECQQVGGNGYYLGPHCDADKTTISIGVYADEDCSIYIGDEVSFYNVMGFEYDSSELEVYYDSSCTSCRESDKAYQNVDGDEEDADDINELCQNLYQGAGKCNRYMYDAEDGSYQGYNQEANEDEVCGFIKNVVTGQYDEYGYIYLDSSQYETDNRGNRYAETGAVTAGQLWGILGLTALCSILTIWACFLHRSLTRNTPWRPKLSERVKNKLSPRRNRSDKSGIMLGRGGSYTPPDNYA